MAAMEQSFANEADTKQAEMEATHQEAVDELQAQLAGASAEKDQALADQETKLKKKHDKEMDEAMVVLRMIQSRKKDILDAMEQASKCQETLSFIRPWKVSSLSVLEVALVIAEV